ncbi:MAG: hypothetical protein AAB710_01210 [Patescibacteria group bacterium]
MRIVSDAEVVEFKEHQSYVDSNKTLHKVYIGEDGALFEIRQCRGNSGGCGASLEVFGNDLSKRLEGGGYGGFDPIVLVFYCARCGKKNYLEHVFTGSFKSPLARNVKWIP